jgi:hypothetical protein
MERASDRDSITDGFRTTIGEETPADRTGGERRGQASSREIPGKALIKARPRCLKNANNCVRRFFGRQASQTGYEPQ